MHLADFIPKLEAMGQPASFDAVKRAVAISCLEEVDKCFQTQSDPYGTAWATRKKDVPWPILYKSGALHGSFTAYPTATGIHFEANAIYAARQNYGGGGITARNMLPNASKGLPSKWTEIINRVFFGVVQERLAA